MANSILKVDENDVITGYGDKVKCHLGGGILHRAFTLMVIDSNGRFLVTKRSKNKILWPGFWDGSISSHPRKGEGMEEAARRRAKEELGLECGEITFLFKIRYRAGYKDIGSENEVDYFLVADGIDKVFPDKDEIAEYKFLTFDELQEEMRKNKDAYGPWFQLIFDRFVLMMKQRR